MLAHGAFAVNRRRRSSHAALDGQGQRRLGHEVEFRHPGQRGAAANRFQVQPEAQPGGDFVGVFRENSDCSTADVAEAHDANIDVPHKAS